MSEHLGELTTINVDYLCHLAGVVAAAQRLQRHYREFQHDVRTVDAADMAAITSRALRVADQDRNGLFDELDALDAWSRDRFQGDS